MTKKHFEKFAAMFAGEIALARSAASQGNFDRVTQVRNIIFSSADIFAQDNPRFDRERFYAACGL